MKRREFLKRAGMGMAAAGASLAFPAIVSASALGRQGRTAPGNRIVMGALGLGWMGEANLKAFLGKEEVQVVALCDIDPDHLNAGKQAIDSKYGNDDCAVYRDFRELLAHPGLDAVTIALPDHWHAIPAIAAARAGYDIYSEKPLSYNLAEGRAICDAVQKYGRIWQTGSWQRSVENFHRGCELVRNGRIGKIHMVEVGLGQGFTDFEKNGDQTEPRPPPEGFDYDMWLGPAPSAPYCPPRTHKNWRWHTDYGGGMLLDWIGHHGDIAHWGLGLDYSGPTEIEGGGKFGEGFWNALTDYDFTCRYPNGITMRISSTLRGGTKWIGEDGWIFVSRGVLEANPEKVLNEKIGPEEVRLYKSTDHYQNFLDCMRSRAETITPCEIAHRSASIGHVCQIAARTGRKLHWDARKEEFRDDAEANRLLGRAMRSPWHL